MYLFIPVLIIVDLTFTVLAYQWIIRPILRTKRLRWRDFVILDRHRISRLSLLDQFNCLFCGYANGLCTLINREIDQIHETTIERSSAKGACLMVALLAMIPTWLFLEMSFQLVYNLMVSRPLGMHRISIKEALDTLRQHRYGEQHRPLTRIPLLTAKGTFLRLAMALEQIESSWCPLRHFEEREGIIYPEHHTRFFGPDEIDAMRTVLLSKGTVSDRLPRP